MIDEILFFLAKKVGHAGGVSIYIYIYRNIYIYICIHIYFYMLCIICKTHWAG